MIKLFRDLAAMIRCNSEDVIKLKEENKRLKEEVEIFLGLKKMYIERGKWDVSMEGDFVPILADMLYQFFVDQGGVNYVEMRLTPKNPEECGPLALILQRVYGKTPAELKTEYEEENKRLKCELKIS